MFDQLEGRTAEGWLGVELVSIDADGLVFEMEITDRARQPYGLLHGGVSMLLAEGAASIHATWGVDSSRLSPAGAEISGSHLHSAKNGRIESVYGGGVCQDVDWAQDSSLLPVEEVPGFPPMPSLDHIVHEIRIVQVETERRLCLARVTNTYRPARGAGALGGTVDRKRSG